MKRLSLVKATNHNNIRLLEYLYPADCPVNVIPDENELLSLNLKHVSCCQILTASFTTAPENMNM
jgi:hypothetical protein